MDTTIYYEQDGVLHQTSGGGDFAVVYPEGATPVAAEDYDTALADADAAAEALAQEAEQQRDAAANEAALEVYGAVLLTLGPVAATALARTVFPGFTQPHHEHGGGNGH